MTIEYLGTLPVSPLIFAASAFGVGSFIMMILCLVCCRKPHGTRKRDEEFDEMTT